MTFDIRDWFDKAKKAILSPQGRNVLVFLVFVVISAVLWMIMTLNEEIQKDLRCKIEIINKPDSVTMISYLPDAINVNVRAKGSQLLKYSFGEQPTVKIDYKYFIKGNTISMGDAEIRGLFKNMFGSGAQILAVNPDSLQLQFTSRKPVRLPVYIDSHVKASPSAIILGLPKVNVDTVSVYSMAALDASIRSISTTPINITGLTSTKSVKVRLVAPEGCRVVPDSVTVTIDVEKLIAARANMQIETIGVPKGERLLLFPNNIEVSYMLPIADYEQNRRDFKIVADYRSIIESPGCKQVKLSVITLPTGHAQNFSLSADSVSFMIEQ